VAICQSFGTTWPHLTAIKFWSNKSNNNCRVWGPDNTKIKKAHQQKVDAPKILVKLPLSKKRHLFNLAEIFRFEFVQVNTAGYVIT